METSLHRALKRIYAGDDGAVEVQHGTYRIDAVRCTATSGGKPALIEVQHASLAAIRRKVSALLREHDVIVVKPIVVCKLIERRETPEGPTVSTRRSPKRGSAIDVFDDLVHFASLFPHRRLCIETPLVEIAEVRFPGHGRRRRRRKNDFQIADQRLLRIVETRRYRTAGDLLAPLLAPSPALAATFDTAQLASALSIRRAAAQRIAYCLRHAGATQVVGKRGNSILYRRPA